MAEVGDEASRFVPLVFPAWIKWGQRTGASINDAALAAVYPDHRYRQRVGDVFALVGSVRRCGWCGGECRGRRTAWCSAKCADQFYRVWSWGRVRVYIYERDGGKCRACGTEDPGEASGSRYSAWEVDHITPVKDGGTDDPENLRLLCHDCHVTAGIQQRRARRAKVAPELFGV